MTGKKMIKKITSIIGKVLVLLLTISLVAMLFLNISTLWSVDRMKRGEHIKTGYFSVIIGSGSMEPAILVNDLLLIKGGVNYEPDDIITYLSSKGSLITHRIREITQSGYIPQGDANNIPDGEISAQQVLGKVFYVLPAAGVIIYGLLSPAGIIILICALILFLLIQSMRRDKNEDTKKGNAAKESAACVTKAEAGSDADGNRQVEEPDS